MSAKVSACNWSTRTWSGGTSTSKGAIEVTPSIVIGMGGESRACPGLSVRWEGGSPRNPGGGRRLREVDHFRDRTSPPSPQGSPDRKDRDEAPPDLHRAGPRRKIQLRNTGRGSREEDGRGRRRDAILPGRDDNIPLGRG